MNGRGPTTPVLGDLKTIVANYLLYNWDDPSNYAPGVCWDSL